MGKPTPMNFIARFAPTGRGGSSPVALKTPVSLILASRARVMGLPRSKLAPPILSDSGARITFAGGWMLRSSAEILASFAENSRSSKCHGGPAATAGAAAGTGAGVELADPGGGAAPGAAGVAGPGATATPDATGVAGPGATASLSKLNDPSGSSHVRSLRR